MQKKIIALAIAAVFAAPAAAMAEATLYGSFDAGYGSNTDASGAKEVSTVGMVSDRYATNNWGFKGSDDLGDGMKATYQLESSFDVAGGNGGAIGDRGIAVGLAGGWGAVALGGNQYSTSFKVNKNFDIYGYKFIKISGLSGVATGTVGAGRNDNDVAYTGKFGDVTVMANKTFNPSKDGANVGDAMSAGAVYNAGAITVGASYTSTAKTDAVGAVAAVAASTNMSVGGGFNFGDGNVKLGYISNKVDGATDATTATFGGVDFNVSNKTKVGLGFYKTNNGTKDTKSLMILSAAYSLSKKTTAYAEYHADSIDLSKQKSGYNVGLAVAF